MSFLLKMYYINKYILTGFSMKARTLLIRCAGCDGPHR